jgi:hypothetical protein
MRLMTLPIALSVAQRELPNMIFLTKSRFRSYFWYEGEAGVKANETDHAVEEVQCFGERVGDSTGVHCEVNRGKSTGPRRQD